MSAFSRNQEQMRHYINDTMGGMMPFARFEELGRQNVALFENAVRMFTPFGAEATRGGTPGEPGEGAAPNGENTPKSEHGAAKSDAPGSGAPGSNEIEDLRAQLERLQRKVDDISSRRG